MPQVYHDAQATKRCNVCEQEKFLYEMVQRPGRYKDGVAPLCKECVNKQQAARKVARNPVKPFPKNLYQPMLFYKVCTECGIEQELDQFDKNSAGLLGLHANCKSCRTKYRYDHRQENIDATRERGREYSSKRYHADGEAGEAYRQMVRDARDKWNASNTLKRNEHGMRYRALKRGATIEDVNFAAILEREGYTCCICYAPIDPTIPGNMPAGLTFDHDVPLSRAGSHAESNIKPAHMLCNSRKLNRTLDELTPYQRRGLDT